MSTGHVRTRVDEYSRDGSLASFLLGRTESVRITVFRLVTEDKTPDISGRYWKKNGSAPTSISVTVGVQGPFSATINANMTWTVLGTNLTPLDDGSYEVSATATYADSSTVSDNNALEIITITQTGLINWYTQDDEQLITQAGEDLVFISHAYDDLMTFESGALAVFENGTLATDSAVTDLDWTWPGTADNARMTWPNGGYGSWP